MTVYFSQIEAHLVILRVQARTAKAPLCKGSCRGATEGLLISLRFRKFLIVHFFGIPQRNEPKKAYKGSAP